MFVKLNNCSYHFKNPHVYYLSKYSKFTTFRAIHFCNQEKTLSSPYRTTDIFHPKSGRGRNRLGMGCREIDVNAPIEPEDRIKVQI